MRYTAALTALIASVCLARCGALPQPVYEAHPPQSCEYAPDGSPATRTPYEMAVPAGTFGSRGTLSMWFRPDTTMRTQVLPEIHLLSSEAFAVRVWPRGDSVYVLTDYGPQMMGNAPDGTASPYKYQSLLTHLRGGRWYHAAWTWDSRDAGRNNFYLDGIPQDGPAEYQYPGQIQGSGETKVGVGAEGFTVGTVSVFDRALADCELLSICRSAGHPGYTNEGVRFSGEVFVPDDVDWGHPVYSGSFDDAGSLADWRMEGGLGMRVAGGNMVLENGPDLGDPDSLAKHLVCWLTREVPADFLLEFTFRPANRREGLAIVFFSARGQNGESIFDPGLKPRDGDFRQYHSGDIDCYHTSYWAGRRGTANVRKNRGFHLVAVGRDLVTPAPKRDFQTVRVYKRGGMIRVTVDDVLSVSYDDDGKLYGPVLNHSGWIGLRQMAHSGKCEYGRVSVYPLKQRLIP